MKDNVDLWAVIFGAGASLMKAVKKKMKMKNIVIAICVGSALAFGTLGFIERFLGQMDMRGIMLISFIVGWIANEITDVLDDVVRDLYDIAKVWLSSKFGKK